MRAIDAATLISPLYCRFTMMPLSAPPARHYQRRHFITPRRFIDAITPIRLFIFFFIDAYFSDADERCHCHDEYYCRLLMLPLDDYFSIMMPLMP